jgi:hypothetical protein
VFFEQHPANAKLSDLEEMRETFMQGAYYRTKIDDHLHVLALNTLAYNVEDVSSDKDLKDGQLSWFEAQLVNAAENDKFIISSHIYETVGNESSHNEFSYEYLWNEDMY